MYEGKREEDGGVLRKQEEMEKKLLYSENSYNILISKEQIMPQYRYMMIQVKTKVRC